MYKSFDRKMCSADARKDEHSLRRKRRSMTTLATFATTLAMSLSLSAAFQTPINRMTSTTQRSFVDTAPTTATRQWKCWKLNVLADPDTLLEDFQRVRASDEMYYSYQPAVKSRSSSATKSDDKRSRSNKRIASKSATVAATTATVGTTPKRKKQSKRKVKPVSRSSTMPGFRSGSYMSGRQKAFRDGIRLVEERSGRKISKIVDSPEARKRRRALNGENMYRNSASVPDSLVAFASAIHKVDRIAPHEEVMLGEKTQEAIRLQTLHDDLAEKLSRPPTDDEWCAAAGKINLEALNEAIDEGLEAKNKLVTANLRMVQGVVNLYIRNGLGGQYNAGDLMQEGVMALIRAAEKFDPTRGFRFSTYAMYWIRSAVKRSQIVQSRVIPVPQRLYENHKRILRIEKELRESLGRKPSKAELAESVGMSEVQVERCFKAMEQRCLSLDQGITNGKKPLSVSSDKDTLIELVANSADGECNDQMRILFREDLIATLYRHLPPENVQMLLLRFGLMDDLPPELGHGPMTIAQVSDAVGMKPDKVRRILNKSLNQLKTIIGSEWLEIERELQP